MSRRLTMLMNSGYIYPNGFSGLASCEAAADLFMVIKDICVLKKLSGDLSPFAMGRNGFTFNVFANGKEIVDRIDPKGSGYPYYRLNPVRSALEELEERSWIVKHMRQNPPYGFGDDEQYFLADAALKALESKPTNDQLRDMVAEDLAGGKLDWWNHQVP